MGGPTSCIFDSGFWSRYGSTAGRALKTPQSCITRRQSDQGPFKLVSMLLPLGSCGCRFFAVTRDYLTEITAQPLAISSTCGLRVLHTSQWFVRWIPTQGGHEFMQMQTRGGLGDCRTSMRIEESCAMQDDGGVAGQLPCGWVCTEHRQIPDPIFRPRPRQQLFNVVTGRQ